MKDEEKKKGGGMLLIGIGPKPKGKGKSGDDMEDSGEYDAEDDDLRETKLAAADALKSALDSGDKEAMVDALDAFMDCR